MSYRKINQEMNAPTSGKEAYELRKQYLEDLKGLEKEEYEEIFRIIKRNEIDYSENTNGIFFDLTTIPDSVFTKLCAFMELCKTRRKNEELRIQEISSLRQEVKSSIVKSN